LEQRIGNFASQQLFEEIRRERLPEGGLRNYLAQVDTARKAAEIAAH